VFDTHAKVESFSLLYLNPPYDSEINLTGNRRMERMFLEHTRHFISFTSFYRTRELGILSTLKDFIELCLRDLRRDGGT